MAWQRAASPTSRNNCQCHRFLIKTDAIGSDPLGGRHSSLYFDPILTDLKADNFHPGNRMNPIEGLGQGTGITGGAHQCQPRGN
ncbi:MAG: hypothetical protein CM1200mP29_08320 [Verrucomicrobiota bacterium]|nr:MAG: hypothetical protein CM1200mP29_08320 [Verrucomicrobiota bacterium]